MIASGNFNPPFIVDVLKSKTGVVKLYDRALERVVPDFRRKVPTCTRDLCEVAVHKSASTKSSHFSIKTLTEVVPNFLSQISQVCATSEDRVETVQSDRTFVQSAYVMMFI